jgi:hypothetical protein
LRIDEKSNSPVVFPSFRSNYFVGRGQKVVAPRSSAIKWMPQLMIDVFRAVCAIFFLRTSPFLLYSCQIWTYVFSLSVDDNRANARLFDLISGANVRVPRQPNNASGNLKFGSASSDAQRQPNFKGQQPKRDAGPKPKWNNY